MSDFGKLKSITIPEGKPFRVTAGDDCLYDTSAKLKYRLHDTGDKYLVDGLVDPTAGGLVAPVSSINGYPVYELNEDAFNGASNITKVIIPESVENIEDNNFKDCTSLKEVVFKRGSFAVFDSNVFSGCTNLKTFRFLEKPASLPSGLWGCPVNRPDFYICGVYYRKHGSAADYYVADGVDKTFGGGVIDFVNKIGKWSLYEINELSFRNNPTITELIFPASLYDVQYQAFENCTGLEKVTFKRSNCKISASAFRGCTNLKIINVPWAEGKVANAPWGATNATINYNYTGE